MVPRLPTIQTLFDGHHLTPFKPRLRGRARPTPLKVQAIDDVLYYAQPRLEGREVVAVEEVQGVVGGNDVLVLEARDRQLKPAHHQRHLRRNAGQGLDGRQPRHHPGGQRTRPSVTNPLLGEFSLAISYARFQSSQFLLPLRLFLVFIDVSKADRSGRKNEK
jgi:hypothetical protein